MENYGNGRSTGFDQSALGKIQTGFTPDVLSMSGRDKDILRRLAERVARIAGTPDMAEKRELWRKHNMLEKVRPLVFCDPENGWNEVITEAQMECTGVLARRWEMDLRKEIFWGEEMGDDKPVEIFFDVPYTSAPDDWGLAVIEHRTEAMGSFVWDSPIKEYETDLPKLQLPRIAIDWETTSGCHEIAQDVLGDILTVRLKGTWWWSLGLTLAAASLRGLQNILLDVYDHPDELKALMQTVSQAWLQKLDYLEEHGLLSLNNDGTYIGSGGYGFTDELPQADFSGHVRTRDMWGFADSQETVNVSPRMYEEFVFPYEKPLLDRFGLNCYGCCEPLNSRWQIVKRHHNLRRVSCSPWADLDKMAVYLQGDYILSMKPHPAPLASASVNLEDVRGALRESLEKTAGCVVEVIMKDNHTIGGRPENLVEWCRMAQEEVERISRR
jgi:hypothetical protein